MDGAIETRPLPPPAPRRHPHDRRRGNALRHGLYSEDVVVAGEDADEYRGFRQSLLDVYGPRDDGEIWIVAGMAETLWRLKRTHRIEAGLWDRSDAAKPETFWTYVIESPTLQSALRVEGHLDRRFSRALLDLERHRRLIARRHDAPTPPAAPAGDAPEGDGPAGNAPEDDGDQDIEFAEGFDDDDIGAPRNPAAVDTSAPVGVPAAFEPPAAAAAFAAPPVARATDEAVAPREVEPEVPAVPPANPATRADFILVARARLPVVRRAIEHLRTETADTYREALDLIGEDLRRWWEMRVTRAPGIRETWRDISLRHPFWENNRSPWALRDWLTEVAYDDRWLLEEVESEPIAPDPRYR